MPFKFVMSIQTLTLLFGFGTRTMFEIHSGCFTSRINLVAFNFSIFSYCFTCLASGLTCNSCFAILGLILGISVYEEMINFTLTWKKFSTSDSWVFYAEKSTVIILGSLNKPMLISLVVMFLPNDSSALSLKMIF